jgi:hypothetical protein
MKPFFSMFGATHARASAFDVIRFLLRTMLRDTTLRSGKRVGEAPALQQQLKWPA